LATILLIDDSASDRSLMRETLEGSGTFDRVIEASDGFQGLKYLLNEEVDVVLCDLQMPGFDGEKLLRVKQSRPGGSNIPFLFITASDDLDWRARLLEGGACDAISKPFHAADLLARLRLHLRIKRLQDELRLKNETLAKQSTTDSVTELRTRRYASETLAIEFLRARRYRSPLSILMADLDHFKLINDEFGHPAGDSVLREVSSSLLGLVRSTDVAARYGGEEILVILAQNEVEGARTLAERWRQTVEETCVMSPDGREMSVTISVGVASYQWSMESADVLVEVVDAALYRAKDAGRNRVEVDPGST
jgi:two-component system cell cycle response regulator